MVGNAQSRFPNVCRKMHHIVFSVVEKVLSFQRFQEETEGQSGARTSNVWDDDSEVHEDSEPAK